MISVEGLLEVLKVSPVPLALIATEKDTPVLLFANTHYLQLLGLSWTEVANPEYTSVFNSPAVSISPRDIDRLHKSIRGVYDSREANQVADIKLIRSGSFSDGKMQSICVENTPIFEAGKLNYISQTISVNESRGTKSVSGSGLQLSDPDSGALEKARNEIQKILESSLDVICTIDSDGCFVTVSAAAHRIWGYLPEELVGKPYMDLVFEEDKVITIEASRNIMGGTDMTNFENRYVRKDGSLVTILWSARWDDTDQIMYCIAKDATEKKSAEFELILRERRYRTLVENGADAIVILGTEGKAVYASASISRVLGYSEEEILSLDLDEILHPADKDSISASWQRALSLPGVTVRGNTGRIRHKDGSWRWIEATLTNMLHDPMINGIVDNFRDVTERLDAELEKNLLIGNTEESFVLLDKQLNIISFNRQFDELYQRYFNKTIVKGDSILNYASAERRQIVAEIYSGVLRGNSEISEIRVPDPTTEGERVFSIKFKPAKDSSGEIIGAFVTATDITDRQMVLEQLMTSEERYKLLFRASPLPDFVYDFMDYKILDANDAAIDLYGYSKEEFLKCSMTDILSEYELKRFGQLHEHIHITDKVVNLGIFDHRKKSGGLIKSDVSVYKINFDGRECIMAACNDVTERENAFHRIQENEAKLLASQKIAKVGYWQSFPEKRGLYWSDEVYNIWGRDKRTFALNYESHLDTIHPDDREEFLKSRDRAFDQGLQHDMEHRIFLPDGSIKWVHVLGNLVRNEHGEIMIFEGTVQDITKDKLALEKLLVSEARLRGILESQTNYMIRTDLQGNYSFYNNKFRQDFGWLYEGRNIIGENSLSSIMEYHHERVTQTVERCFLELNKVFQVFIDKPRKDGIGVVTTLWDFICLTDSKGQASEIQCIGIDVSEWEKAQRDLEESNTRYEYVTKATSDAIWDWDLRTDRVYRGSGFKALFGHSGQTVQNRDTFWEQHVHAADIDAVRNNIEKAKEGRLQRWSQEYRFRKSSGEYAFVLDKGILIKDKEGVPIKMVGALQDITARKIAEKQKTLQAETSRLFNDPEEHLSDILYKVLKNVLHYGEIDIAEIWLLDSDKKMISLSTKCTRSSEFEAFYKLSASVKSFRKGEGMPGRVWEINNFLVWNNIDSDPDFPRHAAARQSGIKTGIGLPLFYNEELIGVIMLGMRELGENLLEHEAFRVEFCRHLSSEIKRKQLDQELKQIFSFAPDIITVAGYDGYFKKINPAACLILGYSEEELLSQPLGEFVHHDDKETTEEFIRNLSDKRETFNYENRYITKAGKVIWFAWTGTASPADNLIFAVAKDITEKKNLEVLLEKSNRLAEIGSWEYDIENNSLYWGQGSKQIYELEPDFEPDIERWINFYPEGYNRDAVKNAIEQGMNFGNSWDMELEIISAKGNKKWIRSIGEVERVKGETVKLYGSFQNIHNRKVAELELLKIYGEKNSILESIRDGFYALDKNWIVTYWNHEAENLLLLKRSEVLNKVIWDVFPESVDLKFFSQYNKAVSDKVPVRFEEYFETLNSWFEVSAFPTDEGLTVYFRDVTNRKSTELELLQFKEIIDNSRDGIAIVDLDGKITYINPSFAEVIGYDPLIHDHPETIYANHKLVGQVFDTLLSGKYWQGDVEVKIPTGDVISYYMSGGPVLDESGELKAVYGIHTDITERKQAEQTIRKAYHERNTILESIGDGFFAVDKNWVVNYWNKEAAVLLGKTKKEMVGNQLWDVFEHMKGSDSYTKYQEAIATNQVVHFVDHYPDMNKWYEVSAYPSADGLSVFFKDITERKITDIQVKDLNRVLSNKVKELGISNRELEQFAYVASHDLQEPLRMISSFLTQLQRKYNDQLDTKAHQYINFAVDGARRMRQIILDLLDFSRVGRLDMEKEQVDVNSIITEIIALYRKKIDETKTLLIIGDMPQIVAPKTAIRQLLQNLISNAIKYQHTGNHPLIEIACTDDANYWQFSVKDNGIGISSDYFEKIFIIFQRLHTKDQYSGTGMGLAICRKIVDNLGGRLWLESEEGEGSVFYFTVPKGVL